MLYTLDAEGEYIAENASILSVSGPRALDDLARRTNDGAVGCLITGWTEGHYSDCWIRTQRRPRMIGGYAVIDGRRCMVQAPGSHPGGRAWWLRPAATVMVPVWETEE